jgi:phospholipase C
MGFTFNRLGIRIPAIAISPWIPEKTVVSDTYRNTSVIRTLRERWNLGLPFTARDADAPDLSRVFTLDVPRQPENWPDVVARPVPAFDQSVLPLDAPLSPLAQAVTMGFLELVKQLGQTVPKIDPAKLKGGEAIKLVHETLGHLFPGLQRSST